MSAAMEEQREGVEDAGEESAEHDAAPLPTQMQLLSTWEVRKVPHNCVTRLCTLTVTRLQVRQSLEPSLPSLVVAVSMKTPHRFLRSNEIPVPANGTLDIPLQLTFSLQYPHFLKRGGNMLQIRVQRRKRYRNRPLGGYKTLAMGTVEMSQVLQAGYVGEVQLFSGKPPQALALVTVGSLTSSPVYVEPQREGSSDEEEDDIVFSDYRGSDSDSGEGGEVYQHSPHSRKHKSKAAKPSSRMLRLLGIKSSKTHTAVEDLLELQGEDPESAVTFASSISDSEEDEEAMGGPSTPPRPTLSPFFTSDRCSMVSIPNSLRSAEVSAEVLQQIAAPPHSPLKKYGSLEAAIQTGMGSSLFSVGSGSGLTSDLELGRGRVWVVEGGSVSGALREAGEGVLVVGGEEERGREEVVDRLLPLLASAGSQDVIVVAVVGGDWLVSAVLQATLASGTHSLKLRTVIIPTGPGVVSSRLWLLDESLSSSFPLDTDWDHITSAPLVQYVDRALHTHSLPVAHITLHRHPADPLSSATPQEPAPLPFIFTVSVGSMDADWEQLQPTSPPSASSVSEATELVVEYWTGKKEKEKSSLKVRCVTATCGGQGLSVTTLSRDKRGKGLRIRKKEKEGEAGGSIVSLSTTQLLCRPSNKQETLSVVVDGVEWREVTSVRMVATVGHSVTIATSSPTQSADSPSTN